MTHTDLRASLARLGLTQTGAARLVGVSPREMRRWIAGDRAIPETVARLMHLAEDVPGAMDRLRTFTPP